MLKEASDLDAYLMGGSYSYLGPEPQLQGLPAPHVNEARSIPQRKISSDVTMITVAANSSHNLC